MITGEGRLDEQTLYGKTPAGVAVIASAAGVPVVAIAGTLGVGYQRLRDIGIVAAFSITSGPMTGRIEKTEKSYAKVFRAALAAETSRPPACGSAARHNRRSD